MPDLADGESTEVQGSARQPYVLKNVSGVYSCSCPAWRNQSLPIERRTCKHLVRLRGQQAEAERVASTVTAPASETAQRQAPPLLLAETWDGEFDVAGWLLSEKLDGVRAWWDGQQFFSRQGNVYHAPGWFTAGLPTVPLDGELWLARRSFQRTVSIVRRHDASQLWREIKYLVFDAPAVDAPFEERLCYVQSCLSEQRLPYAAALEHRRCAGQRHLHEQLDQITAQGGEGLMLRQPGSRYQAGRSATLLKVKRFPRHRSSGHRAPPGARPPSWPLGGAGGGVGRRHHVLRGHRLHRRPARESAADRQPHHAALPGADRSRRTPLPLVCARLRRLTHLDRRISAHHTTQL